MLWECIIRTCAHWVLIPYYLLLIPYSPPSLPTYPFCHLSCTLQTEWCLSYHLVTHHLRQLRKASWIFPRPKRPTGGKTFPENNLDSDENLVYQKACEELKADLDDISSTLNAVVCLLSKINLKAVFADFNLLTHDLSLML